MAAYVCISLDNPCLPEIFGSAALYYPPPVPSQSSLHDGNAPFIQESMGLPVGHDASEKSLCI